MFQILNVKTPLCIEGNNSNYNIQFNTRITGLLGLMLTTDYEVLHFFLKLLAPESSNVIFYFVKLILLKRAKSALF